MMLAAAACSGNAGKTPADNYVAIIDEMSAAIVNAKSMADLESPEFAQIGEDMEKKIEELMENNGDYVLTDNDKEKIVKSHLDVAFRVFELELADEAGELTPELIKQETGMTLEELKEASAARLKAAVESCETLGDIRENLDLDLD